MLRQCKLCPNAFFGSQEAGVALEVADLIISDVEGRESAPDLWCIQNFVVDAKLFRCRERIGKEVVDVRDRCLRGAGDDQQAVYRQQRRVGPLLEVAPDLVRSECERRVLCAFADGEPRHAGIAVR